MDNEKKHHLIVAIGRSMGSGGSYVGTRLATRLGCRYLDREIVQEAARRLGRDPEALEALDEKKLNFWERTRLAYAYGFPSAAYVPPAIQMEDSLVFDTEKRIVTEAATRGPLVVVGRAGFWILKDEPGLLSVFLHAPFERRVERVHRIYGLDSIERARELVVQSDRQRGGFIKSATGLDWLDARNYDLALDTWRLGTPTAIELVHMAAMEIARTVQQPHEERF